MLETNFTGRLKYLEKTLQGIIDRFEDEYPETKVPELSLVGKGVPRVQKDEARASKSSIHIGPERTPQSAEIVHNDSDSDTNSTKESPLDSRRASDLSFASRALAIEEGRVHRFGQQVRRDILQAPQAPHPVLNPDANAGEVTEPPYVTALREKLATLSGDEIRELVVKRGWEETVKMIGDNAEELSRLEKEHPEEFRAFREAQLAALHNTNSARASG